MATNKHAIIRYQTLDKCFSNPGRRYYIEDLVLACAKSLYEFTGTELGIKRRQVIEDIKFMESDQGWNIPLERIRDGHRVYFRYEDNNFSINAQPLNETEKNQLKEALLTLSRFKGLPQFEWVDEISARLDASLGLSHANAKVIEFDQNSYLRGLEHITPVYNSILYKSAVQIEYKSFKQDVVQTIVFHPYFLKQYNNRWYVFGKNEESQFIMNLALDRISSITHSNVSYLPNMEVDFNEYFEDIVGVTLSDDHSIQNIVLQVSNELFPYIRTKPIHGSQKVKEQGSTHTRLTLDLIPNYELESVLLSYGEGLEVLQPRILRDQMARRTALMNSNYHKNNAGELQTLT